MAQGRHAQLRLVGHKGAHLITPGNTLESFEAAVDAGADTIEFDVLWTRNGHPRIARDERTPLVLAHDWADAARRTPMTLDGALEAFTRPPLHQVEIDCDLKLQGREDEVVEALRRYGLIERAMVSTMEVSSLRRIREIEPGLRRGWTYPRVTRDWRAKRWATPAVLAALAYMRARLPRVLERQTEALGAGIVWVYHPLMSPALGRAAASAGVELIAWTVDDARRMQRLVDMGVTGLCSNDPRLFAELQPPG